MLTWTDADATKVLISGAELLLLARHDLQANALARDSIQRWTTAVGQYITVVADGSEADIAVARAALVALADEIDAAFDWNAVKNASDAAWLRRREREL